ncbi:MAG: SH3 domain-containing protein [Sphingomonas sp.]
MTVLSSTKLRADAGIDGEAVATLSPGDPFDVLEFAGGNAWGIAPWLGLVGYVSADLLRAG